MGANININLPIIVSFLLLYSLRRGSLFICFWTMARSFFCFFFFIWSSIDQFVPMCSTVMNEREMDAPQKAITRDDDYCNSFFYILYLSYMVLIVVESMLFLYTITLALGIFNANISKLTQYLACRFITWCLEVILLTMITIIQDESKGWFIAFLMLIVLEVYGFIVVYSHLNEICEREMRRKHFCQERS